MAPGATCTANACATRWPAWTIIVPATACHQGSYVETYRRSTVGLREPLFVAVASAMIVTVAFTVAMSSKCMAVTFVVSPSTAVLMIPSMPTSRSPPLLTPATMLPAYVTTLIMMFTPRPMSLFPLLLLLFSPLSTRVMSIPILLIVSIA